MRGEDPTIANAEVWWHHPLAAAVDRQVSARAALRRTLGKVQDTLREQGALDSSTTPSGVKTSFFTSLIDGSLEPWAREWLVPHEKGEGPQDRTVSQDAYVEFIFVDPPFTLPYLQVIFRFTRLFLLGFALQGRFDRLEPGHPALGECISTALSVCETAVDELASGRLSYLHNNAYVGWKWPSLIEG
jgi:hypothetical protein